jgi:hypothetical protein
MLVGSQEIVVTLLHGADARQGLPSSNVFPKIIDLRSEQLFTALNLGTHLTLHLRHAAVATQYKFRPGQTCGPRILPMAVVLIRSTPLPRNSMERHCDHGIDNLQVGDLIDSLDWRTDHVQHDAITRGAQSRLHRLCRVAPGEVCYIVKPWGWLQFNDHIVGDTIDVGRNRLPRSIFSGNPSLI